MSDTGPKKNKLINFRINFGLLREIDSYWRKTGKFTSRAEFLTFLMVDELTRQRIVLTDSDETTKEESNFFKSIATRLDKMEEKLKELDNRKKELGDSLDNHVPQD